MLTDWELLARAAMALAIVLALIAGATWFARRYLGHGAFPALGAKRRLGVVESLAVDGKSRLVLLRRDDTEHLVLLGPTAATVIEAGLPAVPLAAQRGEHRAQKGTEP